METKCKKFSEHACTPVDAYQYEYYLDRIVMWSLVMWTLYLCEVIASFSGQ